VTTIEYVAVAADGSETVLDTITFGADFAATYDTGKARSLVESKQATLGAAKAVEVLKNWPGNGYVLTRKAT
jgi:hypothetical protein